MKNNLLSLHGGHSTYGDGTGRLEDFAQAATERGMVAFGFSEHMPRPDKYWYPGESPGRNSSENFQRYVQEARAVQAHFRGKTEILVGAELELIPGLEHFLGDFLSRFQLDYCVGSVHFVHDVGFDFSADLYREAIEKCGGLEAFCLAYLDTMQLMIQSIRFQVLAHFDLFKVFSPDAVPITDAMRSKVSELMECIASRDLMLDINARGLLKPCREIYPSLEILRIAHKHDVAITLGDDSHAPSEVGKNLDVAIEHARQAGYSQLSFLRADGNRDCVEL
ncbi:MAG TPA: histidinol-phosphatase [Acidobacteriota bacterium]|jgi:histidinol-phosphatase (PHP family)